MLVREKKGIIMYVFALHSASELTSTPGVAPKQSPHTVPMTEGLHRGPRPVLSSVAAPDTVRKGDVPQVENTHRISKTW